MIVGDFLRATVTMAAPNLKDGAKMVWDWELTQTENPITLLLDGEAIVDAIIARYYTPIRDAINTACVITQVELRSYGYPEDGFIAAGTLWTGNTNAVLLPPANTLALQLIRSNFSMRNGRKAYPGATISDVGAGGVPNADAVALFKTATDAWGSTSMEVEFAVDAGATFDEVVITAPLSYDDPVVRSQRVTEYSEVYFGTQNSRK